MSGFSRRNLFKIAGLGGLFSLSAGGVAQAAENGNKAVQADIVVVGAGCAGLVCAIRAKDLGANVVVVEKADRPDGNSIYALGTLAAWGTKHQKACGIEDSRDAFFNDMMKVSAGRADPNLTATYTDNIAEAVDWLQDEIGIQFGKLTMTPWPRLGRGHRVAAKGITGGSNLIQHLLKAAEKRNIPFYYEHKAVELLTGRKGEVTGVRTLTDDGYVDFMAKGGVLISTGGFSANPEMTDKYIGGWASRLAIRGSRNTTGENVSLTKPLFAKMVNMDQFHAGPINSATHVNPADVLNSMHGIIVDLRGNRFMNEKNTYVIKAKECAQKTIENRAFCIVDSTCPVLGKVIPKFDRLNNPYGKADTIEELCKQVGLPVAAVKANVEAYNKAIDAGTLGQLNPPNTYPKPIKIEKAPFYAVPYEGGMTATFGGPLINTKAEVQTLEGRTIPGLYAAGNAAGGLFFRDYIGGSQLGGASVFGTIAAREMTARAKRASK
jgi:flavocytochrome c